MKIFLMVLLLGISSAGSSSDMELTPADILNIIDVIGKNGTLSQDEFTKRIEAFLALYADQMENSRGNADNTKGIINRILHDPNLENVLLAAPSGGPNSCGYYYYSGSRSYYGMMYQCLGQIQGPVENRACMIELMTGNPLSLNCKSYLAGSGAFFEAMLASYCRQQYYCRDQYFGPICTAQNSFALCIQNQSNGKRSADPCYNLSIFEMGTWIDSASYPRGNPYMPPPQSRVGGEYNFPVYIAEGGTFTVEYIVGSILDNIQVFAISPAGEMRLVVQSGWQPSGLPWEIKTIPLQAVPFNTAYLAVSVMTGGESSYFRFKITTP